MPFPLQIKIPDCLGLNWAYPPPWPQARELASFASTGVRWCRLSMSWGYIERVKGGRDFAAYDKIFADQAAVGILPLISLCSDGQKNYPVIVDKYPIAPDTEEAQDAFVSWVVDVVQRYKGRGYIWEIYNEPNNDAFWPGYSNPSPEAKSYHELAIGVARAITEIAPQELVIAPGLLHCDNLPYMEELFRTGILDYLDGVSVHPYRRWGAPETVLNDYAKIRSLMAKYSSRNVAIVSSEWGYPGKEWGGVAFTEQIKARYMLRHFLINIMAGVPVSIWFEWRNPKASSPYNSGGFGVVEHDYLSADTPCHSPTPSYHVLRHFATRLSGYSFARRISVQHNVYLLEFNHPTKKRIFALWKTDGSLKIQLPLAGNFTVYNTVGKKIGRYRAKAGTVVGEDVLFLIEN
ncbi:MAG: cellulase family glycosylhydrolase [Microcoleus sp.]